MKMYKIVVGTDLSEGSATALTWSADLARARGGRLIAVLGVGPDAVATRDEIERHVPIAETLLRAELERLGLGDDVVAGAVARFGDPRGVLPGAAEWHDADLVAVGRSEDSRGVVAVNLLHATHRPVAVVPSGTPPLSPGVIVVGVDGSAANERALEWAMEAAAATGCSVEAVYAYHPVLGPPEFEWMQPSHTAGVEERRAREMVESHITDVSVRFTRVNGSPGGALVERAEASDARILVVGTRGLGGLAGRIVGRVPHQLLVAPNVPTVVVPGHEA